jgi:hypothetical protein
MARAGYCADHNRSRDHTQVLKEHNARTIMLRWLLFSLMLISFAVSRSQTFKLLRYNDDLSPLQQDSLRKSSYEKFKMKQWGKTSYASFGGEVRYLPQNFVNEDWGDSPAREYTAFYTRLLFHSDLRLNRAFRFFSQLNSTFANGRVTPIRSIDENRLAVHQFFTDINFSTSLTLRAGRQELLYGSQRLISVREGPNNRLTFDAVKLMYHQRNTLLDLFYSAPVRQQLNIFDDESNRNERLWGVYLVRNNVAVLQNIDLYYLGLERTNAAFNAGVGREVRHSFGTRWWHKASQWDYDFEAVYQIGSFANSNIQAWTTSIHTNYRVANGKRPLTAGIKTEIISGDLHRSDEVLNTFNPLYPRGAYFGLAALIGPANLIDIHPGIKWQMHPSVTLAADLDLFWRHTLSDGIYGPNVALIYTGEAATERFIGEQLGINAEYAPNKHLTIVPEFTWFNAGPYLKEVSTGKDVFFSAITIQFKY